MLSILDQSAPHGLLSRREWLRIGGLGALGVSLPDLLRAGDTPAPRPSPAPKLAGELGSTFGRAKHVIYLWLQGGPPQHETFDPKPNAPADIRGEFKPIATNVPGIQFCELLPRTARHADRMAVVRSLSTRDDNHERGDEGEHTLPADIQRIVDRNLRELEAERGQRWLKEIPW